MIIRSLLACSLAATISVSGSEWIENFDNTRLWHHKDDIGKASSMHTHYNVRLRKESLSIQSSAPCCSERRHDCHALEWTGLYTSFPRLSA